jgi:hypothetical protein
MMSRLVFGDSWDVSTHDGLVAVVAVCLFNVLDWLRDLRADARTRPRQS